jgi:hypothetical protein
LTRVAEVEWLRNFVLKESSGIRFALGLALAGHLIIAALLLLRAFERTDAAAVEDSMPVEIVMEKPEAPAPQDPQTPPSPTPPAPDQQQNPWPNIPAVADVDKHAKAPLARLDINGIDLPKQPGQDGGDPKRDMAGIPLPSADGELASGADAASSFAMHVAPVGPAPPQTTAREPGEDDITAIKEQKTQCGAKARWQSPVAGSRQPARVIGIATEAQALALIRSSQVVTDRRINPKYVGSPQVFAERLDGAGKSSVVLPPGLTVNVGDVIETASGHVDPSDHCQYIPNLAIGKL